MDSIKGAERMPEEVAVSRYAADGRVLGYGFSLPSAAVR